MKVALTIWEDRISPVADSANRLWVVVLDGRDIRAQHVERFNGESLFRRAEALSALNIETFICGAISTFLANLVEGYGIRLIPFIRGKADDVLNAFITGSLSAPKYTMRGCRRNRHHYSGGRGVHFGQLGR